MYLIEKGSESSFTVNHSRFIGYALPCADESQLRVRLAEIASTHPNAHHLAFAYRIKTEHGIIAHFSDAGEPSGTAGKPILAHISGFDVVNALVAVVRYFGGVKLGAGGLVRAYGGTAKMALESASLIPYVEYAEVRLTIDYPKFQALTYRVEKAGGEIVSRAFGERIDLIVRVPASEAPAIARQFDDS
ncbi:IMPACT family protein [Methylocaldum szegediense]|uniref:YigZ family protein n=1 Tax=Methylocaldum szegediense TaxID=73780 RepID=A0ABM9I6T7_9GAMM|nr:YigZ family protein [Methylocaldum szegediense]CAI8928407.1 putative YigZ family protein [Methylocaldum szegediense]